MPKILHTSTEPHEGDATCLAFFNNQLFSGGADGKIRIWNRELQLVRIVNAHDAYMYAMAVNQQCQVYTSSCDGHVKFMRPPYDDASVQQLFSSDDAVQAMFCAGDMLYTGDDKGTVTTWSNDRVLFMYNLFEEVKSLAGESSLIYTVRDFDVVISEIVPGKSGRYTNKAVFPGKSPLALLGPIVDNKHTWLASADRTGKGLQLINNLPNTKFSTIWSLPNCHEMILNSVCGDDQYLYSGGYDSKVKGWGGLAQSEPNALGEVDVGSCVNAICCGDNNAVYIASSDGFIRQAKFV